MPSNWLYIDTNFPAFTGEESMEEKVTSIQDYMYLLVEQLRYTLHNLDLGNMNKTAKERWESAITEPIYAKIEDDEERILQLAIDAGALALRISDSEGNITQLQATAEGLQTRVSDNEGNISTLQQTAQGLATAIADQSGSISTLQQTASSLSTRISNTDGRVTTLQQTVNGFSLKASNDGEDSTISLMSNGVVVSSANIWFSGLVAFTDLERSNRYTIINADNITTGTIRANLVDVSNCFTLTSGGRSYGYMGCGYGSDGVSMTYGAILSGSNEDYYFIATNAGARMTGGGASIWCSGGCYATEELTVRSDRRAKKDIDYDMSRYEDFFRALKPCSFRMRDGRSGRLHTGYIAQEVEEALGEAGLTNGDFAGLVINPETDAFEYGLRYADFSALHTYMIQRLEERVRALERSRT